MKRYLKSIIAVLMIVMCGASVFAGNPLVTNVRTADPSPIVYNGRYYIVCGQDEVSTSSFNMYAWRLLSSANMSSWTDHGQILRPDQVSWMPNNRAWASDIRYLNGYFYFYSANDAQVGVLRSSSITGSWTDVNGGPLIDSSTPGHAASDIDPMCYIENGTGYLFWGGSWNCRYARLNSNMTSLATSVMDVPGLNSYLEAPFVVKNGSTYFLFYAYGGWPSKIGYATASSITGSWTYRGIIGVPTGTGTNHSGAAYFNNAWRYAYHNEKLSGGNPHSRSVCVDTMTFNGSSINPIVYTDGNGGYSGYYALLASHSGKAADVYQQSTANGANVNQWGYWGGNNQKWEAINVSGNYYKFRNKNSSKMLEVADASTSNGGNVIQFEDNGHYCQQWEVLPAGDGYWSIKNRNSGKALDVSGASTSDGANLLQWTYYGSSNQKWNLLATN